MATAQLRFDTPQLAAGSFILIELAGNRHFESFFCARFLKDRHLPSAFGKIKSIPGDAHRVQLKSVLQFDDLYFI